LEVIIESVNNQKKLTYQELADKLGLELARQEWHTVLDPIAKKMKSELGDDYDLTWNVVYTRGPAKDLGRYFSNGGKATGSTLLDPNDWEQVGEYERTLQKMYKHIYELQWIDGVGCKVIKMAR
jgi:hypothetical protein